MRSAFSLVAFTASNLAAAAVIPNMAATNMAATHIAPTNNMPPNMGNMPPNMGNMATTNNMPPNMGNMAPTNNMPPNMGNMDPTNMPGMPLAMDTRSMPRNDTAHKAGWTLHDMMQINSKNTTMANSTAAGMRSAKVTKTGGYSLRAVGRLVFGLE